MEGIKYFLLNKKDDFVRQKEYLCSNLMDSGEKQTIWSRLHAQYSEMEENPIRIQVFASEQRCVMWKGEIRDIQQIIVNQDILMEEKRMLYSHICSHSYVGENTDCLLNHVTGRYLWLVVEDMPEQKMVTVLPEIQVFFQTESWLSLLPEVYTKQMSKDSFLFRYLSIFQWIYYDMSQKICETPHMLYPAFANRETLEWMAGWFDIDNRTVWNKKQLVYLLENGNWLCSIRGTKQYMEQIVWLFTGYVPFIVEYYQTECYKTDIKRAKLLEELYGENAYVITLILPENPECSRQEAAVLRKIIRSSAPADTECRLVVLEPYIFLDRYTYVGINSRLGGYKEASLNENSLTPYISVVGNRLYRRAEK